ncbi:hypothetical protein AYO44_01155 [Planctomycetaceae bacterium SCGC AG-212-F19]|nr:hypothetical protein AYO44_01155 [Planctomycetaceae bacterium SCGC AG-212-F19]
MASFPFEYTERNHRRERITGAGQGSSNRDHRQGALFDAQGEMPMSDYGVFLFVGLFLLMLLAFVVVAGFFVVLFIYGARANRNRHGGIVDAVLRDWASRRGYQVLGAEEVGRGEDHPFRDKFRPGGFGSMNYGGVVRRVDVRDDHGNRMTGWVFVPYQAQAGLYVGAQKVMLDEGRLEVIWDVQAV